MGWSQVATAEFAGGFDSVRSAFKKYDSDDSFANKLEGDKASGETMKRMLSSQVRDHQAWV